jgi:hypothetical protein
MRRGQRRADALRRIGIGIGDAVAKQACRPFVGRLVNIFDKDAAGVSALQHKADRQRSLSVPLLTRVLQCLLYAAAVT